MEKMIWLTLILVGVAVLAGGLVAAQGPRGAAVSARQAAPETLAEAEQGEEVEVTGLAAASRGLARRRLLDLGLTPGARVRVERSSAWGAARGYRVRGTLIALRREQAEQIQVRPMGRAVEEGEAA